MKPRILILHANGTNRDVELAHAFSLAGADAVIQPLSQLRQDKTPWSTYQLLALPGGFSYADILGAGKLFALDLQTYFASNIAEFVASGKPVIGICNGFQALMQTGLLPDVPENSHEAVLTFNQKGNFECRWVHLLPTSHTCLWTQNLVEPIYCPVAHGEGQLVSSDESLQAQLAHHDQIALRYGLPDGTPAKEQYPHNPNGSRGDIAGICNRKGNVLGLMPHPENHIAAHQHPRWTRGERGHLGLALLQAGVRYVR